LKYTHTELEQEVERLSTREQRLSDDNDELYHKLELLQQRLGAKNTEIGAKSAEIDSMRAQDAQKKVDVEQRLALALAAGASPPSSPALAAANAGEDGGDAP